MDNVATIDFDAGFGILVSSRVSRPAGALRRVSRLRETESLDPSNDIILSQFEPVAVCRETYVCSQPPLTDDRGTHAEKKGPLHCDNSDRSRGERARLRDGRQWAGSERVNSGDTAFNLHALMARSTRTDSLKRQMSRREYRLLAYVSLRPKLEAVCLEEQFYG